MVVFEPGAEGARDRLVEELELVGFDVETARGRKQTGEAALKRDDVEVVVWVSRESELTVMMADDGGEEPKVHPVKQQPGESDHLVALRTAEHLRGRFLDTDTPGGSHDKDDRQDPRTYRVALSAGPALLYRSYAGVGPGLILDGAYFWSRRWGVGPYFLTSLRRQAWARAPDQFSLTHLEVGAQLRTILYPPTAQDFELQALARVGGRQIALRGTTGKPDERFEGSLAALILGAALQINYSPVSWFALGAQGGGALGFSLGYPPTDGLKKQEKAALDEDEAESSPDLLLLLAAQASLRF